MSICIILGVLSVGSIFFFTYINIKGKQEVLTEIKKSEVQELIADKETCWVYVGRPSCPDCVEFYPKLNEFLEKNKLSILYYNTECRASKKKLEREYYNSLGVKSVPSIIRIEDGVVKKVYNTQNKVEYIEFERDIMNI